MENNQNSQIAGATDNTDASIDLIADSKQFNHHLRRLVNIWAVARKSRKREDFRIFASCVNEMSLAFTSQTYFTLHQILAGLANIVEWALEDILGRAAATQQVDSLLNMLIRSEKEVANPMIMELTDKEQAYLVEIFSKEQAKPKSTEAYVNKLAVIDADDDSRRGICEILGQFNYQSADFSTITEYNAGIDSTADIDLIIIDLEAPNVSQEDIFEFASAQCKSGKEVIICSGLFNLETRLAAVRAKVTDFIVKPINRNSLIEKVNRALNVQQEHDYKIVLVDDQETMGAFYQSVFSQHNVHVDYIPTAQKLFESLEYLKPDLFLLDLFMPEVNGIEIAAMLRQEEKFDFAPIVFLTSDDSLDTKLSILDSGADDLIQKSTPANLVVKQVLARLKRSSVISSFVAKDTLTGVLNHGQIIETAANVLRLSSRNNSDNVLALIDLDNFKHINDTYGHAAGDKVLSTLGQQLQRWLRDTDYIGRYGGEEFLIVLQGIDMQDAIAKVDKMRSNFSKLKFQFAEHTFSVTFSVGLVYMNDHAQVREAINVADERMYKAKSSGKNRLISED